MIPKSWREHCEFDEAEDILIDSKNSLSKLNYVSHFHNLLWTEEIQMNIDILSYNIENTSFTKKDSYLMLQVPGLAEKRPSILRGMTTVIIIMKLYNYLFN